MSKNDLQKENEELKRKLFEAQKWMKKEVEREQLEIAKRKTTKEWITKRKEFFSLEVENMFLSKIENFFGDLVFSQIPKYVLENIISAEVQYYNFSHYKFTDWLWIITSYQKSFDYLIEENITKLFRKFANKKWLKNPPKNDLVEKTLYSAIQKWYILWAWKLYNLLENIKNQEELFEYSQSFKQFLEEYNYIKEILLSDSFFALSSELVNSGLFWEKRHNWKVNFEETKFARKILVWDLEDENCIIFKLVKVWVVEI